MNFFFRHIRPFVLLTLGVLLPLGLGTTLLAQSASNKDNATIKPYTGEPIFLDEPAVTVEPKLMRRETQREPYDDGKTRIEREIGIFSDNHFEADGVYREFYPNGKPFVEGQYLRGRQHGEWTFYHDNGQINRKATYKEGKPDGPREVYRADGTLSAKRGFADGLRDGEWITYDATGKTPLAEEHYAKGKADGTWKFWYPDGKLRQQLSFKQGERNGPITEWDDKGKKRFEANFVNGKLHGAATRWFPDGRTIVQQYEEGKLVSQSS